MNHKLSLMITYSRSNQLLNNWSEKVYGDKKTLSVYNFTGEDINEGEVFIANIKLLNLEDKEILYLLPPNENESIPDEIIYVAAIRFIEGIRIDSDPIKVLDVDIECNKPYRCYHNGIFLLKEGATFVTDVLSEDNDIAKWKCSKGKFVSLSKLP